MILNQYFNISLFLKYLFSLFLLFPLFIKGNSQSVYIEYGFNRTKSFLENPIQYSSNSNFEDQHETKCLGYEQCISKRLDIYVCGDYSFKYRSYPQITWRDPETSYGGFGEGTTRFETFAFGLKYKKSFLKDRLSIYPGIYMKLVDVKRTWPDSSMLYWDPIEYYPYSGISYTIAYPDQYLVPEFRFAIDVRFLWRMHLYLNLAYARGFQRTQDLVFEYSYKGIPQPKTVAYVNGTELRFHLGLKFDIVRCRKKEINNHINPRPLKKKKSYK